jgi:transketolase
MKLSPYALGSGEAKKKTIRDACSSVAINRARKDERIVVLDADLALSTKTIRFGNEFPKRFFDVGIAEKNLMGIAAGLAAAGKLPIAATFAAFATGQCYNTIRQSIAYPSLNVKIYATHSGISVGGDGATHQMLEDLGLMRSLPNFTVTAPADVTETMAVMNALLDHDGPTYMRIGREDEPEIYEELDDLKIGKGIQITDGSDVTIAACGTLLKTALEASRLLAKEKVSARVIDLHTIKPMDGDLLEKCARETGAIVTCEEHNVIGGLGGAVAEELSRRYPTPQEYIGTQDRFGESGSAKELIEKYGLGVKHVAEAARKAIKRRGRMAATASRT